MFEPSTSQSSGQARLRHISQLTNSELELLPPTFSFPEHDGHLCMEITGRCDARCRFCLSYLGKGALSVGDVNHLGGVFKDYGVCSVVVSGGEPTLNSDYVRIIALLRALGIRTTLTTNALSITEDDLRKVSHHLPWITVSLHSADPTVQDQLMGRPRALLRVLHVLDFCARIGLDVRIHTVVSQKTIKGLLQLSDLLRRSPAVKSWKLMKFSARARGAANAAEHELSSSQFLQACDEIRRSVGDPLQLIVTQQPGSSAAVPIVHNSGALLMLTGHDTISVGSLLEQSIDAISQVLKSYGVRMTFPHRVHNVEA